MIDVLDRVVVCFARIVRDITLLVLLGVFLIALIVLPFIGWFSDE